MGFFHNLLTTSAILENPSLDQFQNAADAGGGSVTFTNSTLGGATLTKKMVGNGSFVEMKLTSLTNASSVVLALDHLNNAIYDWGSPSFDFAVYSTGGDTYYASNANTALASVHFIEASQVNDILRIVKLFSSFQIWRFRASAWTMIQATTFTYKTEFFVKVINAAAGTSKQIYDLKSSGLTEYKVNVSSSEVVAVYSDLVQATDAGSGTLTFNNAALPNGATVTKRFGGIGSYIEWTMPATLSQSSAVVMTLGEADDQNYTWSGTGSNFILAVYHSGGIVYFATYNGTASPTDTGGTVVAGDMLRIFRIGQNEVTIDKSTDSGANWTLLRRLVSLRFSKNPFIKVLNAAQAASKRLQGLTIYGQVDKVQYTIPSGYKPFFVYAGESNSGGRALNSSARAAELDVNAGVKIFDNIGLAAFNSLDIGVNNLIDHAGLTGAPETTEHAWELELSNMVDRGYLPSLVYLVKTGQGGTRAEHWQVGNTGYAGVNVWQKFLDRMASLTVFDGIESDQPYPIVFLTLGINDRLNSTAVASYKSDFQDYIDRIEVQLPGCKIVLTLIIYAGTYIGYNSAIRELALENGLEFVFPDNITTLDANHWDYRGRKNQQWRMIETVLT